MWLGKLQILSQVSASLQFYGYYYLCIKMVRFYQDTPVQTMQHLIQFPEACSSSPQAAWSFTWFSVRLKSVQMDPNQFQVNVLKYQYQQKEAAGFQLDPTFSGLLHFP